MKVKTKWKIGVGGTHSSPTALGLGISAPHPRAQNAEFGLGLGGGTKVFYPLRPDYRRFKIPSFTSPGHTHSHVCAPFSFCRIVGRGSSVVRHLPLVLEVPGSIPARGEKNFGVRTRFL